MVSSHTHGHDQAHSHGDAHEARAHDHHAHSRHVHSHHVHDHGPAAPHPAQAVTWSILRMTAASRLAAAAAVAAVLWAIVWLAMT